jgi:carboxyl-terminal processing protease
VRILIFLLCWQLAIPFCRGDQTTTSSDAAAKPAAQSGISTNAPRKLAPGPNDGRIASLTANLLQRFHYLSQKQPFDAAVSSKFLDSYLNTLDPQHIHFLQSDVAEFEKYRTNLDRLTLRQSDTTPAYVIFNRYFQRLEQRAAYARELLTSDPFDFTSEDRVMLNRKNLPFPKDIEEARQLWRERACYEYLQEKLNKETPEEIAKLLASRQTPVEFALMWTDFRNEIVKVIDHRYSRILRTFREWDNEEVLQTYLTALAHVYDPHSDYMDRATLENFSIQMSLALFGVGATLTSEDGYCKVSALQPSGPAARSKKIKPGDRIVAVAQGTNEPVDVVEMSLTKVVEQIRGPKGTEVRLTIIPADAPDSTRVTVNLVRDEIKLEDQQAKAKIIELPNGAAGNLRLGVIDLPSFYATFPMAGSTNQPETKSTTVDVERLLKKLKEENVSGVILDLRRNGGGSLEEAINLTGLFIKEGPVVQVRDSHNEVLVDSDQDPKIAYDGPLIVLTSRFSASASEIVAGALQDYGRALLVGDKSTHGKGTVQGMNQLAPILAQTAGGTQFANETDLGALKLTIRKFYRASGSSTQLKGVTPDIALPSIDDYLEIGEDSLENALPWDTIESAAYEKLNRVQPYLEELEKRSAGRVAAAKDFDYVREDIETVRKTLADKTASLNETEQLKEREKAEAQKKARDRELKARKALDEKIYEITLKHGTPFITDPRTNQTAVAGQANPSAEPSTLAKPELSASGQGGTNVAPAEASDSEKAPVVDADLEEAEHILTDYITLLKKDATLTASDRPPLGRDSAADLRR